MKKNYFMLLILLIMVVGYAATQMKIDIKGNTTLSENTSDFNVYLANLKLNGTEIEGINATKDGYEINVPSKGTLEYDVINDSTEYDVEATVECEEETGANEVTNFDYTGSEQTFVAPVTGVYKLETWGAQGGNYNEIYHGGYGAYSEGKIDLEKNQKIFFIIGGIGNFKNIGNGIESSIEGGYNGGANASGIFTHSTDATQSLISGGGSTHVATKSGLLSTLENNKSNILIVSSGGAGAQYLKYSSIYSYCVGSSGGGLEGTNTMCDSNFASDYLSNVSNATQSRIATSTYNNSLICKSGFGFACGTLSGGGSGYYGGASNIGLSSSGSSYIGNSLLTEKSIYCYNCVESTEESTKTISTTCVNETPTENCAKSGNGYARISLINN